MTIVISGVTYPLRVVRCMDCMRSHLIVASVSFPVRDCGCGGRCV